MKRSVYNRFLRVGALAAAALLLFSACRRPAEPAVQTTAAPVSETQPSAGPDGSITLPYTSLDPVNPFFCESILNTALIPLVFQSLYYLDAGFTPVRQLAAEEVSAPQSLRVTLQENASFSDGSALTAADVVYSFSLAKDAPLYETGLQNIEACEQDGNRTVLFTLREPDVNARNLLTFPIAKTGTADAEDAKPCGSGYYVYAEDDLRLSMTRNERSATQPRIGSVRLYDITDASSLMHLLDTGRIDCFYTDLSEDTAKRSFSGTSEVYLNNLVFLGINHASAYLSDARVRRAISLAVSRAGICENAFLGHARAAFYPFNTSWDLLSAELLAAEETGDADPEAADALLESVGGGSGGNRITYKMICVERGTFLPTAAKLIAEQLESVNVVLNVELMSPEDFRSALKNGDYDFYLSEIKLTKNMDLSPFFTPDGAAAYGLDLAALSVDETYFRYLADGATLDAVLEDFTATAPFIPLLYRNGLFCFSRSVKNGVEVSEDNLFINVADWEV